MYNEKDAKERFIEKWRKEFGCRCDKQPAWCESGIGWCETCTALAEIWSRNENADHELAAEIVRAAKELVAINIIYYFDLGKMPLCQEEYDGIFGLFYDDGREPAFSDLLVHEDKGHYSLSVKNPTVEIADTLFIEIMGNRYPIDRVELKYQRR